MFVGEMVRHRKTKSRRLHAPPPCLTLCTPRACSQTEKERCPRGTSSSCAKKKKRMRVAMKYSKTKVLSKRGEAAGVPASKTAAKGLEAQKGAWETHLFFIVGIEHQVFFCSHVEIFPQPNKVSRTGRSYRNAPPDHLSTLIHEVIACKPLPCPSISKSCPNLIPLILYSISSMTSTNLISYLLSNLFSVFKTQAFEKRFCTQTYMKNLSPPFTKVPGHSGYRTR